MAMLNNGEPFLTSAARDLGFSDHHLRQALRAGTIRRMFRGVLVDGAAVDGKSLRLAAARLVVPAHAIVSDDFAAWLYEVDTTPPGDRFELRPSFVVPHGRHRIASSRARTRQTVLPDVDVVEMDDLRITSPIRTAADLLRLRWRPYALAAADALAHARVVDERELAEYVAAIRRLRGAAQAKELAPWVDRKAESHGESWQRCRILDAGFPRPTLQHKVYDADGRLRRLDMAFLTCLVASEYDGREFHSGTAVSEVDQARREDLSRQYGWRFNIGRRENVFGEDPAFERELGDMLGIVPRRRTW